MKSLSINNLVHAMFISILLVGISMATPDEHPLTVSCALKWERNYARMPVPIEVAVSNCSDRVVVMYSNNKNRLPVPWYRVRNAGRASIRLGGGLRSPNISIKPHSEMKFVYYINQFSDLRQEGLFVLDYQIDVRYIYADEENSDLSERLTQTGSLQIELHPYSQKEQIKILDGEISRLDSNYPLSIIEVAESVCYLEDPLSLDYIGRIIGTDDLVAQRMSLDALQRFDNKQSANILIGLLNPKGDSEIVQRALDILSERNIELDDEVLNKILGSSEVAIRNRALRYVEDMKK